MYGKFISVSSKFDVLRQIKIQVYYRTEGIIGN